MLDIFHFSSQELQNEASQTNIDAFGRLKTFIIIAIFVYIFILSIILGCYILKRSNEFLGLVLSFFIGIAGFLGLFLAKEKNERKSFYFGWIIGYSIRIFYAIGFLLGSFLI